MDVREKEARDTGSVKEVFTWVVKTEQISVHDSGTILDLVGNCGAEEGGGHSNKEDKKDSGNEGFHGRYYSETRIDSFFKEIITKSKEW